MYSYYDKLESSPPKILSETLFEKYCCERGFNFRHEGFPGKKQPDYLITTEKGSVVYELKVRKDNNTAISAVAVLEKTMTKEDRAIRDRLKRLNPYVGKNFKDLSIWSLNSQRDVLREYCDDCRQTDNVNLIESFSVGWCPHGVRIRNEVLRLRVYYNIYARCPLSQKIFCGPEDVQVYPN